MILPSFLFTAVYQQYGTARKLQQGAMRGKWLCSNTGCQAGLQQGSSFTLMASSSSEMLLFLTEDRHSGRTVATSSRSQERILPKVNGTNDISCPTMRSFWRHLIGAHLYPHVPCWGWKCFQVVWG